MSSNDQMNTQPTIETVLERINSLGEELRGEINGLRGEVGGLRGEVGGLRGEVSGLRGEFSEFRKEVFAGFHKVARQIGALSTQFLEMTAVQSHLEDRIERLESKLS
jgi:hypothetical protein